MKNISIIIFIIILIYSCDFNKIKKQRLKQEILAWNGKQICLPENIENKSTLSDSLFEKLISTKYKVLIYIDSLGCTPCKLQLDEWNQMINETRKINESVSFLFYINVNDYKIVEESVRMSMFDYPLIYDIDNEINHLNQLSNNPQFHVFLLDSNNKVLLVGNPISNQGIKNLFLQQILK